MYSILGFNQESAMNFEMDRPYRKLGMQKIYLDCTDLLILKWLRDNWEKFDKYQIDEIYYSHIKYGDAIKDLQILRFNKRSFSERLKKLVEFKILKFKSVDRYITLFAFDRKFDHLCNDINHNILNKIVHAETVKLLRSKDDKPGPSGYIYIFKCNDLYKIGKSNNPTRRFNDFNYKPYPIEIVYISKRIKDVYKHEHHIHKMMRRYCFKNEWYKDLNSDSLKMIYDYLEGVEVEYE